jgi:hypothetical protein
VQARSFNSYLPAYCRHWHLVCIFSALFNSPFRTMVKMPHSPKGIPPSEVSTAIPTTGTSIIADGGTTTVTSSTTPTQSSPTRSESSASTAPHEANSHNCDLEPMGTSLIMPPKRVWISRQMLQNLLIFKIKKMQAMDRSHLLLPSYSSAVIILGSLYTTIYYSRPSLRIRTGLERFPRL